MILLGYIEAGAILMDSWLVPMPHNLGIGMLTLQTTEQVEKSAPLSWCTGVSGLTAAIEAALVAHAEGVGVIATGMCTYKLFVAGLVHRAITSHVVVVASEPEPFPVVADQL